jgi:sulfate/thiosulfate transport system substrate-binding protein
LAKYLNAGVLIAIVAAIVWTCGGTLFPEHGRGDTSRIIVYGFSILAEPLRDEIFPLFRRKWRAETGHDVEFLDSFAGSGTIANQIVNGTPVDIAILSHPGDADRIFQARMTSKDWRDAPHGGILNRTPFLIAVRRGNPKGIRSYADLGRGGIDVIHPDPLTSGGAQWAIIAEYAEPMVLARAKGRQPSEEVAYAQLLSIWQNVRAQAPSARAARTQFDQGFGDALITYEVELLLDQSKNQDVEIVIPPATILSEHPIVVVDRNIRAPERPAVDAFVSFLHSEEAQRAFVRHGFRSVNPKLDVENERFAKIEHAYLVAELGGWERAREEIIERIWKGRVLVEARR